MGSDTRQNCTDYVKDKKELLQARKSLEVIKIKESKLNMCTKKVKGMIISAKTPEKLQQFIEDLGL